MSGPSYRVPPASWREIGDLTWKWRTALGLSDVPEFPIAYVLEHLLEQHFEGFYFDVAEPDEMAGGAEGVTAPDGSFICLRADVYEKLVKGDPRARFTAAHELGHFSMHTNIGLARVEPGEFVRPFEESEAQANQFAAELLMPESMVVATDTAAIIMDRFGVSHSAASHRLSYLQKKGMRNEKEDHSK